jgi:hypothetical protein
VPGGASIDRERCDPTSEADRLLTLTMQVAAHTDHSQVKMTNTPPWSLNHRLWIELLSTGT